MLLCVGEDDPQSVGDDGGLYIDLYRNMVALSAEKGVQITRLERELKNVKLERDLAKLALSEARPRKLTGNDVAEAGTWVDALLAQATWVNPADAERLEDIRRRLAAAPRGAIPPHMVGTLNRLIAVAYVLGIKVAAA